MASAWTRFTEWYSEQHWAVKTLMVVGGGGIGVAAGVVAAPAVGALASAAGLGVAGGTLSGAAASSAGLAALGGGSVAAGGLGMAGGTIVVASSTGALVAGAATTAAARVHRDGSRSRSALRRAQREEVEPGAIRLDGEEDVVS